MLFDHVRRAAFDKDHSRYDPKGLKMSEIVFLGLDWIQLAVIILVPIFFFLAIYLGLTAGGRD